MPYKFNPFTANLDYVSEAPGLGELSDVNACDPQNGEFLVYNGSAGMWERAILQGLTATIVFLSTIGQLNFKCPQHSHHVATVL